MDTSDYWRQARFWTGEYRRRAPRLIAGAVPPTANSAVVRALEDAARRRDLTLGTGFPRVAGVVRATHELAPSAPVRIPATDFLAEDVFYFPPVRVHELAGVTLDVASGLLFVGNWVVNGSGTGQRWARDSAFITGASSRVAKTDHPVERRSIAPLGNAVEFYHFLMETLPQVLRVRQAVPDAVFVTTEQVGPFARAILDLLGIGFEVMPRHTVVECEHVAFCESNPRERTHPADMDLLAETLIGRFGPTTASSASKVYISRSSSLRALADEARLEEWLASRGFVALRLESMSIEDQVHALAAAEIVVAPHGGGLANTVFMRPGGRVVELATGEWWSNAFRRISHVRGHDYTLVPMASTPAARWGSADEAIGLLTPLLD